MSEPAKKQNEIVWLRSERLRVELWSLGARLNALHLDGGLNLTLGSDSEDQARGARLYFGAIVGPVANRIANCEAAIDGKRLPLDAHGARHLLHSGPDGTQAQVWEIDDVSETCASLSLRLHDGFGELPGNRTLNARYEVDGAELCLELIAKTDAPTLINLAHHPYWSLNGDTLARLSIAAEEYLPVDEETIPTGDIAKVAGTEFDHRTPRVPSPNLDHNFCRSPSREPTFASRLEGSSHALEILTTAPGLQAFAGKPPGIALEPQMWPDAPNHPDFPSIRLGPDETFRQKTVYRFSAL